MKPVILCVFYLAMHCGAVSFIDPCKPLDNACILESTKKAFSYLITGDTSLGLPSADPMLLESLEVRFDYLRLIFKQLTIRDLSKCDVLKAERSPNMYFNIDLVCPLNILGKYITNGIFSSVHVEGNGDFFIKSGKVKLLSVIVSRKIERDGKKYLEFARGLAQLEPIELINVDFKNISIGEGNQAGLVKDLFTSSTSEIIKLFVESIYSKAIDNIMTNLNKILDMTPATELELS